MEINRLFISRDLKENSPLINCCKRNHIELFAHSLLEFQPIPFFEIPAVDWIFFYSQKGVKYFFEQLKKNPNLFLKNEKLAAIGPISAKAIESEGHEVSFSGSGEPVNTAYEFKSFCKKSDKILFVRANNSRQSIQKMLNTDYTCFDVPVYDNFKKQHIVVPKVDLLIFMSPLNVAAYLDHYTITNEIVIAIGTTTEQALKEKNISVIKAAAANEAGICQTLEEVLL